MNERRTRPSAPVNDRVEDAPRAYDWVSPWSLDPDLPPPRRPRPLGLSGNATASIISMPPPGLSSTPERIDVEPLPETPRPPAPTASPNAKAPSPSGPEPLPEIVKKADPPSAPPAQGPPPAATADDRSILPPPTPQPAPQPAPQPTPQIKPAEPHPRDDEDIVRSTPASRLETSTVDRKARESEPDASSARPSVRSLPSFPNARIDAKPREPILSRQPSPNPPGDEDDRWPDPASRPSRLEPQLSLPLEQPRPKPNARARTRDDESGISWSTLIFLCLGLLSFAFGAWIYLHDIEREVDDDLRIDSPVDVTPVITTPDRLQTFLHSIVPLESRELALQSPSEWDTPSLSRFVQANGPALDNLKDLLEDPNWHPRHSSWHGVDLGGHRSWVHAGILKQAEAAYLARLQKEEAAFTAAVDLSELARRLEDMWAWPSFTHRALDLHRRSDQSLAALLRQTRLPETQLAQFQEQHERCAPDRDTLVRAVNAFYTHEKKLLLGAASGEPLDTMPGGVLNRRPGRLLFKVNETLSLFGDCMRQLKSSISEAPFTEGGTAADIVRRTRKDALIFYQPNAAGQTYFCDRMEGYTDLPELLTLARTRHGLVHTLFAVRRSLAATKRLPQSLPDLVPDYLEGLPTDPYSGEAFLYNAPRGILYSVGDNFTDENGMITEPPMHDPGEPTVQVGVAAAAAIR